ncbi:MAG: hypothetical protein QXM02_06860 [Thermoproteota archaeon]
MVMILDNVLVGLVVGVWVGSILNAVWYARFSKYEVSEALGMPLQVFEHYHWATVLTILGLRLSIPMLLGVALVWLLDEAVGQEHKFSIGSKHFLKSLIVELAILLVWLLVEVLLKLLF